MRRHYTAYTLVTAFKFYHLKINDYAKKYR